MVLFARTFLKLITSTLVRLADFIVAVVNASIGWASSFLIVNSVIYDITDRTVSAGKRDFAEGQGRADAFDAGVTEITYHTGGVPGAGIA